MALAEAVAAVWVKERACKPSEAREKETNSEVKICQEEIEPVHQPDEVKEGAE